MEPAYLHALLLVEVIISLSCCLKTVCTTDVQFLSQVVLLVRCKAVQCHSHVLSTSLALPFPRTGAL